MDNQQVAYFADRYSRMTDEELSYLLVTRGESLSEEANHALKIALKGRDAAALQEEINATTSDVAAQVKHARQEAEKQKKQQQRSHTAMRIACAALVGAGLLAVLAGKPKAGLAMSGLGAAMFLYFELRRLLWRFVAALFRA